MYMCLSLLHTRVQTEGGGRGGGGGVGRSKKKGRAGEGGVEQGRARTGEKDRRAEIKRRLEGV